MKQESQKISSLEHDSAAFRHMTPIKPLSRETFYFLKRVLSLDWGPVAYLLLHKQKACRSEVDTAIFKYCLFLALAHLYPTAVWVPTIQLDNVHEAFYLDSQKYRHDMNHLDFSLEHYPYKSPEDAAFLEAFQKTKDTYYQTFAIPLIGETENSQEPGACYLTRFSPLQDRPTIRVKFDLQTLSPISSPVSTLI